MTLPSTPKPQFELLESAEALQVVLDANPAYKIYFDEDTYGKVKIGAGVDMVKRIAGPYFLNSIQSPSDNIVAMRNFEACCLELKKRCGLLELDDLEGADYERAVAEEEIHGGRQKFEDAQAEVLSEWSLVLKERFFEVTSYKDKKDVEDVVAASRKALYAVLAVLAIIMAVGHCSSGCCSAPERDDVDDSETLNPKRAINKFIGPSQPEDGDC